MVGAGRVVDVVASLVVVVVVDGADCFVGAVALVDDFEAACDDDPELHAPSAITSAAAATARRSDGP